MTTVSVIVTSFNRPTLLRECLMSVAAARPDQVIVADDGSDFNVAVVAARALYQRVEYTIAANPPIAVGERMTVRRQGALINRALGHATGDIATLICDDDLMAPGWLDTLRAHWTIAPRTRLIRGKWLIFQQGETPTLANPRCPMCPYRKMTAGNFAWRADLTRGDRPRCQWPEAQLNCLDDGFLRSLHAAGVDVFNVPEVGFAGWRREHPKVNNNHSDGSGHLESFRAVLEAGWLE